MAIPVRLKVFKGDVFVTSREFERDIIKIGRLASAHLCLEDENVSRIHSVIEAGADGALSITDMGSVGGTHVNGRRVTKGRITFGDEIRVGDTTLRLEDPVRVAAGNLAVAVVSAEPAMSQAVPAPVQVPVPVAAVAEAARASVPPSSTPIGRVRRSPPLEARGPLGVSLRFLWGDRNVGEFFVAPGARKGFSVGSAAGVDFVMGDARLGTPRFEVLRTDGQGFTVFFTGRMKGGLTRNGDTRELRAVIESGLTSHEGEAHALSLEAGDFLWMDLGGVQLEVCFQPVPRRAVVQWTDSLDFTLVNVFLVMFFLAAFFVISADQQDADATTYADELSGDSSRIAKLIVKPPEVQQNRLLQQLDAQKKEKQAVREASRPREDKPRTEQAPKPERSPRADVKGPKGKQRDVRGFARSLFNEGSVSTLFTGAGPDKRLTSAMDKVGGPRTSSLGNLGLPGLREAPGGDGGTRETVGIGNDGIRGRSNGEAHYGEEVARLGPKQNATVSVAQDEVQVSNSLDRELIRRVIQLNRSQVRYCYEHLLNRYPSLSGKVSVRFVISAAGSVATSDVAQATTGNSELEKCVAGKVRGWVFPKLKGGGSVVVTYPFLFKPAGE